MIRKVYDFIYLIFCIAIGVVIGFYSKSITVGVCIGAYLFSAILKK